MTHYLPAFTRTDGVRQEAVCHRYIFPMEHSTEPSCPDCQRWLGVEPELSHEMVSYALPPDLWSRDVGPCLTRGCVGVTRAGDEYCIRCRFRLNSTPLENSK